MRLEEYYGGPVSIFDLDIATPEGGESALYRLAWLGLIELAWFENGKAICRRPIAEIAKMVGCSRNTLYKALDHWSKLGRILKTHRVIELLFECSSSVQAVFKGCSSTAQASTNEANAGYSVDSRKSNVSMCGRARLLPEKDTTYLPPPYIHKREGDVQSRAEIAPRHDAERGRRGEEKSSSVRPLPRTVSEVDSWFESASDFDKARFCEKASEGYLAVALLEGQTIRRPDGFRDYRLRAYRQGVGGLTCALRDYKLALDRADEIRAWRQRREEEANKPPPPPKPTLPDFPLDPPEESPADLEEGPLVDWLCSRGPKWEAAYGVVKKRYGGSNSLELSLIGFQKKLDAEFAVAKANGGIQAHSRDIRLQRLRFLDRMRVLRGGVDD